MSIDRQMAKAIARLDAAKRGGRYLGITEALSTAPKAVIGVVGTQRQLGSQEDLEIFETDTRAQQGGVPRYCATIWGIKIKSHGTWVPSDHNNITSGSMLMGRGETVYRALNALHTKLRIGLSPKAEVLIQGDQGAFKIRKARGTKLRQSSRLLV